MKTTRFMQKSILLVLRCSGIKRRFQSVSACNHYINKCGQHKLEHSSAPPLQSLKIVHRIEKVGLINIIKLNENASNRKVVIYFHGGAFVEGCKQFHLTFCESIAKATNSCVIIPLYTRLPIGNVSLIVKEMLALASCLQKNENRQIAIMGDSAGGWLALSFTKTLKEQGIIASHCILLSPWLDLKMERTDHVTNSKDVILSELGLRHIATLYNPHGVGFSLESKLDEHCSYYLFVSKNELFYNQTKTFEKIAKSQNANVEVVSYEGLFHDFMFFPLSESQDVKSRIINIINIK